MQRFALNLISGVMLLALCCCTTAPPPEPEPTGRLGTYKSRTNGLGKYNKIDIDLLIQELKMVRAITQIGYQEKKFNTCQIKANFSDSPSCENLYIGVLNFQMVCRTNDAIVKREEMAPLQYDKIRWKRGYLRGLASTDKEGFGTMNFITDVPSHQYPVIFNMDGRMVFKRLHDQWQMILPNHWCDGSSDRSLSSET